MRRHEKLSRELAYLEEVEANLDKTFDSIRNFEPHCGPVGTLPPGHETANMHNMASPTGVPGEGESFEEEMMSGEDGEGEDGEGDEESEEARSMTSSEATPEMVMEDSDEFGMYEEDEEEC